MARCSLQAVAYHLQFFFGDARHLHQSFNGSFKHIQGGVPEMPDDFLCGFGADALDQAGAQVFFQGRRGGGFFLDRLFGLKLAAMLRVNESRSP